MTTYLRTVGQMPISVDWAREEIGLITHEFDAVIETGVARVVLAFENHTHTVLREQIWTVTRNDGQPLHQFFRSIRQIGKPHKIGAGYRVQGEHGVCHDVEYRPVRIPFNTLIAKITVACLDDFALYQALKDDRAVARMALQADRRAVPAQMARVA